MDESFVKNKRKVYYTSAVPSSINDKWLALNIGSINSFLEVIIGQKLGELCK